VAVTQDVATKPKMPQTWRKHLLQHSTTTTPEIRAPQLLDDNALKTARDIAGDKSQSWHLPSSAISHRSLASRKKFSHEERKPAKPRPPASLPTRAVCPSSMESFFPAAASQICTKPLCVPTATKFPWTNSKPWSVKPVSTDRRKPKARS